MFMAIYFPTEFQSGMSNRAILRDGDLYSEVIRFISGSPDYEEARRR